MTHDKDCFCSDCVIKAIDKSFVNIQKDLSTMEKMSMPISERVIKMHEHMTPEQRRKQFKLIKGKE